MRTIAWLLLLGCLASSPLARASVFGQVQGVVHDPSHRPITGAHITVRAAHSYLSFSATSDGDGAFRVTSVPLGDYVVSISFPGFTDFQQAITITADSTVILHFPLTVSVVEQSTTVHATPESINPDSFTPSTLISRTDIASTPGADRTNSLAMITDYVPGAYMTHDMLHMRGGHQLSWLIDGCIFRAPTSPATSARRSTQRTSITWRRSAVGIRPLMATAPTVFLTPSLELALSATTKVRYFPPLDLSCKPTIK